MHLKPHIRCRNAGVAVLGALLLLTSIPIPGLVAHQERIEPLLAQGGLTGSWKMFAPDMREAALHLEVVTWWGDGTVSVVRVGDRATEWAGYRGVRWHKLAESTWNIHACEAHRRFAGWWLDENPTATQVALNVIQINRPTGRRDREMRVFELISLGPSVGSENLGRSEAACLADT
jgi:hypothetical protein